jgi:Zinc-ribbon containing domain
MPKPSYAAWSAVRICPPEGVPAPGTNGALDSREATMNDDAPAGRGVCKCTNCGEIVELPPGDELPSCPSCGHDQWTRVEGD